MTTALNSTCERQNGLELASSASNQHAERTIDWMARLFTSRDQPEWCSPCHRVVFYYLNIHARILKCIEENRSYQCQSIVYACFVLLILFLLPHWTVQLIASSSCLHPGSGRIFWGIKVAFSGLLFISLAGRECLIWRGTKKVHFLWQQMAFANVLAITLPALAPDLQKHIMLHRKNNRVIDFAFERGLLLMAPRRSAANLR